MQREDQVIDWCEDLTDPGPAQESSGEEILIKIWRDFARHLVVRSTPP
jgi:hypothetical protein